MSLRSQINLLITLLMLMFVIALVAIEIDDARRSIREEMEAATRVTVQVLTNVIGQGGAPGRARSPEAMSAFLDNLGRVRANDIRVLDADGGLVYASPPSSYKAGRNAPRWFAQLVTPRFEPITVGLNRGMLVVVPEASRSVIDAWDDLVRVLWLAAGFLVMLNVLMFWLASRALHPVKDIVAGLKRLEQGDWHARLPTFAVPEMNDISHTFNRMAEAVEESFAVREKARETAFQLRQNRELTHLIQHHVEEERRILARELHDELGQLVTGVKSIAQSIVNRYRERVPDVAANAQAIVDASSQMYDAMHGMVRQLRPLALDNLGLPDALRDLVGTQQQRYPEIRFELTLDGEFDRLGEEVNITSYRVVQECLTNVVRHAQASEARVELRRIADAAGPRLEIRVLDNGRGLGGADPMPDGHFGVLGMRERVEGLAGKFELREGPQRGVVVEVSLPLAPQVAAVAT